MRAYQCPYQVDFDCPFVDSLDMSKPVRCQDCKNYGNGVRPTGATPIIGWFIDKYMGIFGNNKHELTDEEKKMEDHNRFMMSL